MAKAEGRYYIEPTEVTVFGAGVAGLTAAHELMDRGFTVSVIESDLGPDENGRVGMRVGGMAMTQYDNNHDVFYEQTKGPTPPGSLPGEHGFRFFPSYYHHLWDIMQRTPLYQEVPTSEEQGDFTARVWNADGSGQPVEISGHQDSLAAAAFSPDGDRVVTASGDGTALIHLFPDFDDEDRVVLRGHRNALRSAVFDADGGRVATASLDRTARVWNADGSGEPVVLRGHGGWVQSAAFSPDGSRLVTASSDCTARIWNSDGSGEPVVLCGHEASVASAAFSPDGARVVTASWDGTARIWNADGSGAPIVALEHPAPVVSAAFSPDGAHVVTAAWDQQVRIWNSDASGDPVPFPHDGKVMSAAFDHDGTRVVTGSWKEGARVWNADGSGSPIVLHVPGQGPVASAAFSQDGSRVVTAHAGKPRGPGDKKPVLSDRTVFDNVMPCSTLSVIASDRAPFFFARQPVRSAAALADQAERLLDSGFSPTDLNTYAYRTLRYMCTCSARRAKDCEDIAVRDYLEGYDPKTRRSRYRYSDDFLKEIEFSPRILAAMDAKYGDARSNLSTTIQLLINNMIEQPKVDGVLNGPSTEAWLRPWRDHLEHHGVRFISARLRRLRLVGNEVVPEVDDIDPEEDDERFAFAMNARYLLVALDAPAAESVTEPLLPIGVPGDLRGYTTQLITDPRGEHAPVLCPRDPYRQVGMEPWDRFQTLTGLQYFFDYEFSLVHGHVYFPKAAWGLSAICPQDFWVDRPNLGEEGYAGILTVDIGEWSRPSPVTGRSAAESKKFDIAREVWRQMSAAVGESSKGRVQAEDLPFPHWYHLDTSIDADPKHPFNAAPYFIPIMKDFHRRPGAAPWDPASPTANPPDELPQDVWRAAHGGSWVHWNRLVFAGTYTKTFTRLTTMEAACESARHAVNAIIDHYLWTWSQKTDPRDGVGYDWNVPPGFTTDRFLSPVYQPTPIGHYCQIWNIEEHELPDLALAKRVDEWFFEHGLPHPWEILGWDDIYSLASWLGNITSGRDSTLGRVFGLLRSSGLPDALVTPLPYAESVLDALRKLRRVLEDRLNRPGPAPKKEKP